VAVKNSGMTSHNLKRAAICLKGAGYEPGSDLPCALVIFPKSGQLDGWRITLFLGEGPKKLSFRLTAKLSSR
jgi:hypothetical protein